ncbi:hypothetical protein SAMN04487910_3381 [Aquimarina amphilecti]|uniref:Uncharacterized protein n=1 Tax=Aquimarina amphilecti TaxID=1038014 RepID=A0A1H7TCZ8_AQUAM|nr:hypothetical protein [Aquimarina amphilecti]SEL82730.1 hypothetical protein SAMN04487910_3381 [Aquimarina amphilecti]
MIKDHLDKIANKIFEGFIENQYVIFREINNYHPNHLGTPIEQLKQLNLTINDCRITIANEYGLRIYRTAKRLL